MSIFLRPAFATFVLISWCGAVAAQESGPAVGREPGQEHQPRGGGIVTLYALDPLARAFCFQDGREGFMLRNERIVKRCISDLSFNVAAGGALMVGTDAARSGAIVDLGTAEEIRGRYGFDNAAGAGVGFATLRLHADKLAILVTKEDRPQEKVEYLKEGQTLSGAGPSAPAVLGHIYVVRIADTKDGGNQMLVKLMVIAYTPTETVTLRWEVL